MICFFYSYNIVLPEVRLWPTIESIRRRHSGMVTYKQQLRAGFRMLAHFLLIKTINRIIQRAKCRIALIPLVDLIRRLTKLTSERTHRDVVSGPGPSRDTLGGGGPQKHIDLDASSSWAWAKVT